MERFRRLFTGMTLGGIAGLLALLVLGGTGLFLWGSHFLQVAPSQCASCHPQLTAMWERSLGHPAERVGCHECHGEHADLPQSGNLFGYVRDSLIPAAYWSAETTVEARCEGCHDGVRQAETEEHKVIRVNHKVHLATVAASGEAGPSMGCLDCHRNIAHDKTQIETNRPTMAGCFLGECHRKDRNKDNCRRCHYQQLTEPGQGLL